MKKPLVHRVQLHSAKAFPLGFAEHILDLIGIVRRMKRDQRMDGIAFDLFAEFEYRHHLARFRRDIRSNACRNTGALHGLEQGAECPVRVRLIVP